MFLEEASTQLLNDPETIRGSLALINGQLESFNSPVRITQLLLDNIANRSHDPRLVMKKRIYTSEVECIDCGGYIYFTDNSSRPEDLTDLESALSLTFRGIIDNFTIRCEAEVDRLFFHLQKSRPTQQEPPDPNPHLWALLNSAAGQNPGQHARSQMADVL